VAKQDELAFRRACIDGGCGRGRGDDIAFVGGEDSEGELRAFTQPVLELDRRGSVRHWEFLIGIVVAMGVLVRAETRGRTVGERTVGRVYDASKAGLHASEQHERNGECRVQSADGKV
jgi:hypothetical protein